MKKICIVTTISVTIKAFFIPQIKYLAENGYDVSVICSPDSTLESELGENIHYIPVKIERGIKPKTIPKTISELRDIFKREKFDMVQYSTPNAAFCAAVASWLAGIKVRNYHLMGLRYLGMTGMEKWFFKTVERIACKLSTDIECISKSNLELCLSQHLFRRSKAVIVGNGSTGGIDTDRFSTKTRSTLRNTARHELSIENDEFVFGFVGRITRDKGVNELITAFSGLENKCRLLIVGSMDETETLDEKLWKYAQENERIIIHDATDYVEKYYAAMDVLVLPTYREGFGMVVAEAEAMGVPAIVSNIPGPIDVIKDGVTGLTVNVGDSTDLMNKMRYLSETPELLNEMSQKAAVFAREKYNNKELNKKILERKRFLIG